MKKLLLPLVLLLLGVGGGVGAGLALAPPEEEGEAEACAPPAAGSPGEEAEDRGEAAEGEGQGEAEPAGPAPCEVPAESAHGAAPAEGSEASDAGEGGGGEGEAGATGHDYVKLPNQFVVPVVEGGEVVAMMLLSLSVEVPAGGEEGIAPIEPKLRDAFLRVLFDHANTGGFEGMFTASGAMRPLRAALLAAAEEASGGLVTDVLIVEMVRQDR